MDMNLPEDPDKIGGLCHKISTKYDQVYNSDLVVTIFNS